MDTNDGEQLDTDDCEKLQKLNAEHRNPNPKHV